MTTVKPGRPVAPAGVTRARRRPNRLVVGISAGAVIAVAVTLYLLSPPAFVDLDVYRKGVLAWWSGRDLYGPLPPTIAGDSLPFIYPPFAVLFLGPLAAVPWPVAAALMLAISLSALGLVIYLSAHSVCRERAVAVTVVLLPLTLGLEPVEETLWFGQINLVLMALVALDCLPSRTRWPRGVLVGLAAAVKLTRGVFLLYFLLRKDYRATATAAATGLAATVVGFLLSWRGSLEYWFGSDKGARGVSGSPYLSNQTVDGLFARLGLAHSMRTAAWLAVVAVVLVVAAAAVRRAHVLGQPVLAMAATGCFGLIASPTSWGHHWVYVVPGLIAMGGYAARHRDLRWTVACGLVVVVFVIAPYRLLPSSHLAYLHWNWWQQIIGNSYVLLGIALLSAFGMTLPRPGRTPDRASEAAADPKPQHYPQ